MIASCIEKWYREVRAGVSMQSTWNPSQYNRFRGERSQPFFDLLALLRPHPGARVVDLGCGTGELTRVLHQRLGARETLGIDNSESMLAKSKEYEGSGLRFERREINQLSGDSRYDIVFSNAALHWVDNHAELFPRLTGALATGGQLAVQMPANHDHAAHVVANEVAAEEPFRTALDGYIRNPPLLAPEAYASLLNHLGYQKQHVRLQVYPHLLAQRGDVVEWVKGTLLTDYQRRMSTELFEQFLVRYRQRLLPRLADEQPYFYPFKRLLLWAQL